MLTITFVSYSYASTEIIESSDEISNSADIAANNNLKLNNFTHAEKLKLQNILKKQNDLINNLKNKNQILQDELIIQKNNESKVDYAGWASILLACVSILVTVLGVIIAVISFIGFKNIKETTNTIAHNVSNEVATKVAQNEVNEQLPEISITVMTKLIDEGKLKPHLESAVDMILRNKPISEEVSGFKQFPEIDEDDDAERL